MTRTGDETIEADAPGGHYLLVPLTWCSRLTRWSTTSNARAEQRQPDKAPEPAP